MTREQIDAYGIAFHFVAHQNGIRATLRKQGKTIGTWFYRDWSSLLTEIQPVNYVHVFVFRSDSIFLPR